MIDLRELFIENFNVNNLMIDLMDYVEKYEEILGITMLEKFMIDKFNDEFMYAELFDLFKERTDKEGLKETLEYMGHDFIDLDELKEKRGELE